MPNHRLLLPLALLALAALLAAGCEPDEVFATPQIIVITSEPTATPPPTATPVHTRTPVPTPTREVRAAATLEPCVQEGGQILAFEDIPSQVANAGLRYKVYVPPCYFETAKRYPAVFLIHGANNTEEQWETLGIKTALDDAALEGTIAPMIVVMPFYGSIGNDNTYPPDPSFETVLMDEILPAIDRDFCTWSDRAHRALGGISRGGFWAFSIGLRYPDRFGILGGHSAYFAPDIAPPAFNPLDLALNDAALPNAGLRMYLDNGASDVVGANLQLFSSRLSSRGIAHTYLINPVGGHDDEYWAAHLREYLAFYARDWPKNPDELPSCLEPSP